MSIGWSRGARGRRGVRAAAVGLAAVAALAGCRVVPVDEGGVAGWSRGYLVLPAAGSPAALYLWVTNLSAQADSAMEVRVAAADSARMHQTMAMGSGMEQMAPLPLLAVGPHDTVRFTPGGMHIMVFGLDSTLRRGDSTQVTVVFRRAGEVTGWAHVITYADVDSLLLR